MKYFIIVKTTCIFFSCTDQTSIELNVSADSIFEHIISSSCRFPGHLCRTDLRVGDTDWEHGNNELMRCAALHLHTADSPWLSSLIACLYSPPTMHCAAVMSASELHQREASERIGPGAVDRNINMLWNGTERLQFSRLRPSGVWNQPNKLVY